MPGNAAGVVDAAGKYGLRQLAALKAIHLPLYGFDRTFDRLRLVLRRRLNLRVSNTPFTRRHKSRDRLRYRYAKLNVS